MQKIAKMASRIQRGQKLQGRKTYYNIVDRLNRKHENLWVAK